MEIKEKIIELITAPDYKPSTADIIYSHIAGESFIDYNTFYSELYELENEGEIIITKREKIMSLSGSGYILGRFRSSKKDFGFVTPDSGERDIFIPPSKTLSAIEGDRVICEIVGHDDGKSDVGNIIKIISHSLERVIGTLKLLPIHGRKKRIVYTVEPDDKKFDFTIVCVPAPGITPVVGNKVEVEIKKYPKDNISARGEIVADFGEAYTREANYEAILHEYGIKTEFDKRALAEADMESQDIPDCADGRLDMRDKIIFTIDGSDAKDLDDAISIERNGDGYVLGVHIADVSHYVRENSALDNEAFERGTSVYFTDKVVPMLPKSLSNGICSLNADVPRRTLSAFINIDKNGGILSCDVRKTLISSKVRGVYSEVNDIIEKGENSEFYNKYSVLFPDTLPVMLELYYKLDRRSAARGALDLETSEAQILVDENSLPCGIVRRTRGTAEKLIEQFMLAANEGVANWLSDMDMPCVYRVHDDPDPEKIHRFALFAHNLGIDTSALNSKKLHPSMFSKILKEAKEKDIGTTVSYVLLRSLSKAKYSSQANPHFGLCIDKYCHFTSPIRRYPDLSVHRIISNIISGNISDASASYFSSFAQKSAEKSSENELRAQSAERDIDDLYKCIYMLDYIGEEFDAVISSVNAFGFFAELDNTCEGLVPISSLDGYYIYDENTYSLTLGKKSYKLGDRVRVVIEDVDIISRKIDMQLV